MPTYDYLCQICGCRFEYFQSMSDEPLNKCPECGGSVRRLVSGGSGLIFKGTGFYLTDYKKSNSGKNREKKTDVKPAATIKSKQKTKKDL